MTTRDDIVTGIKGGLVVAVSTTPFAILFGALAIDNGLTAADAALMSATVYAGASQLVGIELFGQHVAPWLIILSVFAVNFRHVLYSAAITRFIPHFTPAQKALAFALLIDPQFAETVKRADAGKPITFAWYLAFALAVYFPWIFFSVVGAWFGAMLDDPRTWSLDVLLPVYFMGLVIGFRRRRGFYPVVAASAIGSVLAYAFVGSPWHVSIGAALGILVAALLPPRPAEPQPVAEASS